MVYILLGTGFEEVEAITPCDILRRGGVEVKLVGVNGRVVTGGHGVAVGCDLTIDELELADAEMLVLPGGLGGVKSVGESKAATDALQKAWNDGKYVCAICAGPTVLAKLGITKGREVTCYPGCEPEMGDCRQTGKKAVRDGKLITGQAAGAAADFGFLLLETLEDRQTAETIRKGMVFDGI